MIVLQFRNRTEVWRMMGLTALVFQHLDPAFNELPPN
jgi:hypothetical protein